MTTAMPRDPSAHQPVGKRVEGWTARPRPAGDLVLNGRTCRVEALDPDRHASALYEAWRPGGAGLWTYMPIGPFADEQQVAEWATEFAARPDLVPLAVVGADGRATGTASYLRVEPEHGSIEVGYIVYGSGLQQTTAGTEAMALLMRHVFDDLGYRRYEWKCNALNAASRRAALRLGFAFEGVHRQSMIVKGRNRDTAWYSMLDTEWPRVRDSLAGWLDPANTGADGRQVRPLAARASSASTASPAGDAGGWS